MTAYFKKPDVTPIHTRLLSVVPAEMEQILLELDKQEVELQKTEDQL